jgi:hypothetical protein
VVKRIGDELMVTFKDLAGAECFVDSPVTDTVLQTYQYKIAVDFGSAYHFRFVEHLADDPYGPVVDRCARIAKYAGPSTVICSRAYRNRVANPAAYVSIGNFALRGWLPVAGAHPKVVGSDGADLITWHMFRHTFASRLTREGVDIVTVKELLGHSNISTTMRYAHSNDEAKRRAVQRLKGSDKTVTVVPRSAKIAV